MYTPPFERTRAACDLLTVLETRCRCARVRDPMSRNGLVIAIPGLPACWPWGISTGAPPLRAVPAPGPAPAPAGVGGTGAAPATLAGPPLLPLPGALEPVE